MGSAADTPAARAISALGVRFQLGGTSPEAGFDCAGLAAWTHQIDPATLPSARSMGRVGADIWHDALIRTGFTIVTCKQQNGDLLLLDCGRGRLHIGVHTPRGLVHAHAGLGRVVLSPDLTPMRALSIYRNRIWQP